MNRPIVLLIVILGLAACGQSQAPEIGDSSSEPALSSRATADSAATAIEAPSTNTPPAPTPVPSRVSALHELPSNHVDDVFNIQVSLPGGYDPAADPGYHVIYVTDGDLYFDGAGDFVPKGGVVKVASQLTRQGSMPPAIVVGIGYTDDDMRDRDFHMAPDDFYRFIAEELIPFIDEQYNTDPFAEGRTLIGHSWGSYFVLYTLFHHAARDYPFHNLLAISGYLTAYDRLLYGAEQDLHDRLGDGGSLDATLFLTIGNQEYTEAIESNIEMHEALSGRGYQDFRSTFVLYSGQEHYGIVIPAVRTGLSWLFS
jgi:enterochelin esterase-like enzyme